MRAWGEQGERCQRACGAETFTHALRERVGRVFTSTRQRRRLLRGTPWRRGLRTWEGRGGAMQRFPHPFEWGPSPLQPQSSMGALGQASGL